MSKAVYNSTFFHSVDEGTVSSEKHNYQRLSKGVTIPSVFYMNSDFFNNRSRIPLNTSLKLRKCPSKTNSNQFRQPLRTSWTFKNYSKYLKQGSENQPRGEFQMFLFQHPQLMNFFIRTAFFGAVYKRCLTLWTFRTVLDTGTQFWKILEVLNVDARRFQPKYSI